MASDEPVDLRQALIDAAQLMRDNYTLERNPWIIPPRVYDEALRQIDAGTAKPETITIMRNAVRAEEWEAECTCHPTDPSTWTTYGSAVEPGSMFEPDPDCPRHR